MTIAASIRTLPGPEFQALRYPVDYALDLAIERGIVPKEHVDAGREEVRAGLCPGVKRGPETRAVLRSALRRRCAAEGEDLDVVYRAMADRYLTLHAITKA
ncbi:hypothetical protein ACWDRR_33150 [Kitasatospora sp. NPDC003701]